MTREHEASLALRQGSLDRLKALLAAYLEGEEEALDERDVMVHLAPFHDAARRLGAQATAVFDAASEASGPRMAELARTFGRRTDVTPAVFGWRVEETEDGPSYRPDRPRTERRFDLPSDAWWGRPVAAGGGGTEVVSPTPQERALTELIAGGTLDAELAGLLWLLVDRGFPLVVAGPPDSGRTTMLTAILGVAAPAPSTVALGGADPAAVVAVAEAGSETRILAPELLRGRGGIGDRGALARALVAAAGRGASVLTTVIGERLEDVFARLRGPAAGISDDQLSFLGLVVVMGRHAVALDATATHAATTPRVVAAHYVRPIARDGEGHVQRLGPAVLATWEPASQGWEHFAWGIYPELAARAGMRPGDLELEHAARRDLLAELAAAGVDDPSVISVRWAFDRRGSAAAPGRPARPD